MNRKEFIKQSSVAIAAVSIPLSLTAFKTINDMETPTKYDVIIIGGSYSGLSAAMALGRSLRKVLVIDAGKPCNRQTPASHNFLTRDGESPAAIAQKAKEEVLRYPTVELVNDFVESSSEVENGFELKTTLGQKYKSRKLIFATGIKDLMPDISGFSACWGISVVHCPYCHGYEIRKVKTGILANGDAAFDAGKLIFNWTGDLTIFTNGKSELKEEQAKELMQKGISIVETPIAEIKHKDGYIQTVEFENKNSIELKALYARIPLVQHSILAEELGCELDEHGFLSVDSFQKTSVDGISACGDSTTFFRSVAHAVHSGNVAGAALNMELIQEGWG